MNLWKPDLQQWRDLHLVSPEHRKIMAICEVECFILHAFGIDVTAESVPHTLQNFAACALERWETNSESKRAALETKMWGFADEYRKGLS